MTSSSLLTAGMILSATGIGLSFIKRRVSGIALFLFGLLGLGAWQWDRAHERTWKCSGILMAGKLVKENRENPMESLFEVEVADTDRGAVKGVVPARDIAGKAPGHGVNLVLAERPLTGVTLRQFTSRH